MRLLKWRLLPGLAAVSVAIVLLAIPAALPMQWWLAHAERNGSLCPDPGGLATLPDGTPIRFAPDRPCTDLRQDMAPGAHYVVDLRATRQWCKANLRADPAIGIVAGGWRLLPLRFHRRVANANWLKPLAILRRPDAMDGTMPGAKVRIDPLDLHDLGGGRYRGIFTDPAHGGRLYLALNDVAVPAWPRAFYADNRGAAIVSIRRVSGGSCANDGCTVTATTAPAHACGAAIVPPMTEHAR